MNASTYIPGSPLTPTQQVANTMNNPDYTSVGMKNTGGLSPTWQGGLIGNTNVNNQPILSQESRKANDSLAQQYDAFYYKNPNVALQTQGLNGPPLTTSFPQTPQGTKTTGVVTSKVADDHANGVQSTTNQANTDLANHNAYTAQQSQQNQQNQQAQNQQDITNNQNQQDVNASTSDKINQLINQATGVENTLAQPNALQQDVINNDPTEIAQMKQTLQSVSDSLKQMALGTYPLTTAQQAQVSNVASQFASALSDAQKMQQAQIAGQTMLNARSGIQMYSPTEALSNIQSIIDKSQKNIAKIDLQIIDAQDKLTTAIQDGNYKYATQLYNDISQGIKDKSAELKDANDAVQKATDTMNKNYYDQVTKPIQDISLAAAKNGADPATIAKINSATNPMDAITAAGGSLQTATGQIGDYLQYKRDALANGQTVEDYATWKAADDKATAKEKTSEAYGTAFATASGKAAGEAKAAGVSSNNTLPVTGDNGVTYNVPAGVAPYVKVSANGVKYVDAAGLTAAEKGKITVAAFNGGVNPIPVITDPANALDINNITDATLKLKDMKEAFDAIAPGSATERNLYYGAAITMATKLQTNPDAVGLDIYQDAALDILKAMSGTKGFRGGTSMVDQVKQSFPKKTDTQAVVDTKIANMQKLIDDRQQGLIGRPSASDQLLLDGANAKNNVNTYIQNNPDQAQSISNMYSVPGATDAMIYQYLKQSGKLK